VSVGPTGAEIQPRWMIAALRMADWSAPLPFDLALQRDSQIREQSQQRPPKKQKQAAATNSKTTATTPT